MLGGEMLGEAVLGVLLLWTGVKVGALTYAYVRYGNCGDVNAAKPEENVETTSVGGEALKSAATEGAGGSEGLTKRTNAVKEAGDAAR